MERNFSDIIKELQKRGIKEINKTDISNWALVFILEDLVNKLKN